MRSVRYSFYALLAGAGVVLAQGGSKIYIQDHQNYADAHLRVGDRLEVSFPVRPGVRQLWRVEGALPSGLVELRETRFVTPENRPGGVARQVFYLGVERQGQFLVTFTLLGPDPQRLRPGIVVVDTVKVQIQSDPS